MPTVQQLKKKLRSVRSTQKISKAMKTASSVKFSRINAFYSRFSAYENICNAIYKQNSNDYNQLFVKNNTADVQVVILITGNKGMCGGFNQNLLSFAEEKLRETENPVFFICGKQAQNFFEAKKIPYDDSFVFPDIPDYSDALPLMEKIWEYIPEGRISSLKIIYSKYSNIMMQTPVLDELLTIENENTDENQTLFIPDKESFIKETGKKILFTRIYKRILETALSAQAATLTAMRSAYDTASDMVLELEVEINRKRQTQVTADVLETATDFPDNGGLL